MNAVIYARYSSDNQREESIEGQLRECREYAERNGMNVVSTYIDRALSAKTDDRPRLRHFRWEMYGVQTVRREVVIVSLCSAILIFLASRPTWQRSS